MKGYFSQLAQHTGLNFTAPRPTAAKGAARPSADSAPGEGKLGSVNAPLHVEAITFTPSAQEAAAEVLQATDEGQRQSRADYSPAMRPPEAAAEVSAFGTEKVEAAESQSEWGTTTQTAQIGRGQSLGRTQTDSESALRTARRRLPENEPDSTSRWMVQPAKEPSVGPAGALEKVELTEGHMVSPPPAALGHPAAETTPPSEAAPTGNAKVSDADREHWNQEQLEREVSVRDYLKEVMAWVSAKPEIEEPEPSHSRRPDVKQISNEVFDPEHQASGSSLASSSTREPEIHDLDLSIGSISIVIEEPKPAAPVSFQPPPPAERSREQTTREPTNLSRYYLRSW